MMMMMMMVSDDSLGTLSDVMDESSKREVRSLSGNYPMYVH